MCLQTEILEKQRSRDSGATYTFSTLIPPTFGPRFAQLDIADPNRLPKEEEERVVRARVPTRFATPLTDIWRALNLKLAEWKKKKKKKRSTHSKYDALSSFLQKTTL